MSTPSSNRLDCSIVVLLRSISNGYKSTTVTTDVPVPCKTKSQPRVLSRQDAERELRTAKSLKTRPSRNRILTRFPCGAKTSINHPPQRLSTKKAAPRGAAFARSFLLIVTQKLFQHIHRRAANRIFLSGIEKIAYLDFRPNAHGAIAYIARMF